MIRTPRNTSKTARAFVLETDIAPSPPPTNHITHIPEHCAKCYVAAPPKGRQTGWHYTPKGLLCPKDGGG